MDFDLGDVGEFINENPHIPIAAGLVAGQAVRRNVERARQDAAAIKKGLDAIQRQNDEARRLVLDKEQREKSLADNRDFLFNLSASLDHVLTQGYSLSGYLTIEDLAFDLKSRNLTTSSFADYSDKEVLVEVESKVAKAKQFFAQEIDFETRDQIAEVVRWDCLGLKVRQIADFADDLRENDETQEAVEQRLLELRAIKPLTVDDIAWSPRFFIPAILAPLSLVTLVPLFLVARNPETATVNPLFGVFILCLIPFFCVLVAVNEFLTQKKMRAQDTVDKSAQLETESAALRTKRAEIERYLGALKTSVLSIRGIDPDTLSFAASMGITQEQRGKLIEDCDEYICNLLGSLDLSVSAMPTIRRLRDLYES